MKHALLILALAPFGCASSATAEPSPPEPAPVVAPVAAPPPAPAPTPDRAPAPTPAESPTPPASASCKPSDVALFEIDHRVDPGAKLATSASKVFPNGAWTHDETDGDGKALAQASGCLAKADVSKLESTLAGATWKVTTARMHCMAMSPTFIVYQVRGKEVFTQRLCGDKILDKASRAKLDAAVALVEGAAK